MKTLLLTLFTSVLALSAYVQKQDPVANQPLNILWISCEDMSPRLGCYGDRTVPTPNIDRLAREGVRFTNAFCTAGVCAPSRNAIITGMYQTSTGGHNMRTLGSTYPEKTGLAKAYSIVPSPEVRAFPEYLRAVNYYCTNNEKTDYQFDAPPTVWDENSPKAHWRNRAGGTHQQPFFAIFNSTITHESQVWARTNRPLRVDPAKIVVPPIYPDTKTVRQDMARFYTNISEMDDVVGEILKQLEDDGLLDKTIIFFWSDHGDGLPYVKREITDRGLRVPLIVRFPDGRLSGTTRQELISMIDLAPTVLSLANIQPPKHMQGQAFFGSYANKTPRKYVFAARDRIDSEYDRVRSVHDGRYQYVRNFRPELSPYMEIEYRKQQPMMKEMLAMRDAGQLNGVQMQWFRPNKLAEELYDVQADPWQLNNLAEKPQMATHLKRLRQQMNNWLEQTKDLGAVPEKELVSRWWNGQSSPPITANPVLQQKGGKLVLTCATEGASIGYKRLGHDVKWRVYRQPITVNEGDSVAAVAMRIGYTKSGEVKMLMQ